jgi:hypothetical protein
MNTTTSLRLSLTALVLATAVTACQPPAPSAPAGPVIPRLADKPDFNGVWQAIGTANWNLEDHSATGLSDFWGLGAIAAVPAGQSVVEGSTIPYLPAALAKRDENRAGWPKTDPEGACYLPGLPRATYLPHPFQIVQGDGDIFFNYAFASANRAVHMTGHRTIDDVPTDFFMGWSNGKWEGDTLVVEVIANDDRTWFDRAGNYHSNQMKVTERYTPLDANQMRYEAKIEDPETFSAPWTISMNLYRNTEPNAELLEFKCVEFSENLLYNEFLKEPLP